MSGSDTTRGEGHIRRLIDVIVNYSASLASSAVIKRSFDP
jgi:hypothetical protein